MKSNYLTTSFYQDITTERRLYPACIHQTGKKLSRDGIHSGWSRPVPFHILSEYAPGFTKVYRNFFKQIQYKMEILEQCRDENSFTLSTDPVLFETNTYYPPGILDKTTNILAKFTLPY